MANFHKLSTVILLVLIGLALGYFLFSENPQNDNPTGANYSIKSSEEVLVNYGINNLNLTAKNTTSLNSTPDNPHKPKTLQDKMKLVRPQEATPFLDKINFTGENDSIRGYTPLDNREEYYKVLEFLDGFFYWKDKEIYKTEEYWATPNESLSKMKGDEEDFAIALVSLMIARNPDYRCFIVGNGEFESGVICYLGSNKQFYRFGGSFFDIWRGNAGVMWGNLASIDKESSEQDKLIEVRKFRNDFLDGVVGYCCVSALKDQRITFAYNNEESYEFKEGEEAVNWLMGFIS